MRAHGPETMSDETGAAASTAIPGDAVRRTLPPVGIYLRAVTALGLASLSRGLPAVVFLYFYRLGMGLYLAFAMGESSPLGTTDQEAAITSLAMAGVAYIPLLALVYTPFVPLQESILSGGRRSLLESVRLVLERLWPFFLSVIAQGLLIFGPPLALFAAASAMLHTAGARSPDEVARVVALLALIPCFAWMVLIAVMLMFAVPALVLDSRGPLASIRVSLDLVARHFGGILGRLFVFFLLAVLVGVVASLPEAILHVASAATGFDAPLFRIARVIWSSAVSAFLFPFSVASLTVLYRALVPGPGSVGVPAGAAPQGATAPPVPGEQAPAASPFRFE